MITASERLEGIVLAVHYFFVAVGAMLIVLLVAFCLLALVTPSLDDPPTPWVLTEEQALKEVLDLPEIHSFSERMTAVVYLEEQPRPGTWNFYVGENHPTHTVRWATFQVDGFGLISVWDAPKDSFISLADWRSRR